MPYNIDELMAKLNVGGADNIVVNVSDDAVRTVFITLNPATGKYIAFIRANDGSRTVLLEGDWPVVVAPEAA